MTFSDTATNKDQNPHPKRQARLHGVSPDGSEVIISNNGDINIIGGNGKNKSRLIRTAKVYLAIIKEFGYDISNLTDTEFQEINYLIKEFKDQTNL